ncbi:hypothetical protein MKW92_000915 [Papaver armeniacum]|nr:hypothetical protein MKW92_000915 [Papaver armeniacum]
MSRNTQFYTQLPHEGLYGTQPIMDHHQSHLIVPDHHNQQQLHHWGSSASNQNQNQVVWYSQEAARTQQSVISDDEEGEESGGGGGGGRGGNEVVEIEEEEEREHMFEKPLTPSDVGKLNRLVIPKQHAEKYLPLGGHDSLLSFEDESGKDWRFRYSYWNSSQSYVLTKGWSRFVKEKHLDAGDIVMFQRRRFDGERLFIRWRRRNSPTPPTATAAGDHQFCSSRSSLQVVPNSNTSNCNSNSSSSTTTNSTWNQANFYPNSQQHYQYHYHHHQQQHHHGPSSYPSPPLHQHHNHHVPLLYQSPYLRAVGHNKDEAAVDEKMKIAAGGNSKKFRLFGVNLDLPN